MGAILDERAARIHELELLRQDALHKNQAITRDEEARLLQLRLLIMRDENSDLRDQLGQREFKLVTLAKVTDQLRLDLDDSKQLNRAQEARLKKQMIELASLKTEIEALHSSMHDSGKALQEKFALARELDRIRPELEHLQSRLETYQATVAERNDLRRQVDSLEVELENEKRSRQRLQSKNNDAAIAELTSQLEEAGKKIAAEQRERERNQRDHEKQIAAASAEKQRLDERISGLKEKSKALQAEVKKTTDQLEATRSELALSKTVSRGGDLKPTRTATLKADVGGKRRAPVTSFEDIVIQTPGNDATVARERPNKKRGVEKAALGAKSTFSITPFLNRTKSLTEDAGEDDSGHHTSREADRESTSDEPSVPEPVSEAEAVSKPKVSFKTSPTKPAGMAKVRGRPAKATPLGDSTPAKTNRIIKPRGTPKAKSKPEALVENSTEYSSATDQEKASRAATRQESAPILQPKVPEGGVRKRKRKVLGAANMTLLDDDDGEAVAQPRPQPAVAAVKRTKARLGGGVRNAFAAGASFSPLKRDRRGVNASFLA